MVAAGGGAELDALVSEIEDSDGHATVHTHAVAAVDLLARLTTAFFFASSKSILLMAVSPTLRRVPTFSGSPATNA